LWAAQAGEDIIAELAEAEAFTIEPKFLESRSKTKVRGAQDLLGFLQDLETCWQLAGCKKTESISSQEALRLAMWFESEGKWKAARQVYSQYYQTWPVELWKKIKEGFVLGNASE
jgi:hypothetical protein